MSLSNKYKTFHLNQIMSLRFKTAAFESILPKRITHHSFSESYVSQSEGMILNGKSSNFLRNHCTNKIIFKMFEMVEENVCLPLVEPKMIKR